ncbi:putative serine/threonine-protein kinase pbl9, variant 2 [Stylosanthes scabra]|uniref:Serine/threonine-protein kinase pbl9, variant 2 n=1 Tax=Stylosanthes scabra TaxID=79078 RepID=A0ABU6QJA0_9FABA|nr:putative serine/threonine-protein kinase pbl9, variant 2 [Stylosanthes scabra]
MMPPTPTSEGEILHCSNLKSFSLSELKAATRNFHRNNLLGEGDFGSVFKGWIDESSLVAAKPGTGVVIAVKILNQDGLEGHSEWLAEVNYLAQFSHSHLVRLIGYCLKDKDRLLVYEYMPRGSLENYLGSAHFQPLSWSLRLKIALDAAKGLAFLHIAETKVVCLDFKASNVLLDSNYNAKLSVSVLAKDGISYDQTNANAAREFRHASRNIAPEFILTGMVGFKLLNKFCFQYMLIHD